MKTERDRTDPVAADLAAAISAWLRRVRQAIVVIAGLILLASWVRPVPVVSLSAARAAGHLALDILPVKPGGPAQNYAAYEPSTALAVAARALITVTIRNFDLDAVPLAADSPYARVEGTADGNAYVDGQPYRSLSGMRVAHTFTVPRLRLNVPIPGAPDIGARYVEVTFRFRAPGPGNYEWRCFAPCGDGPDGLSGAMTDDGYMRGALLVY